MKKWETKIHYLLPLEIILKHQQSKSNNGKTSKGTRQFKNYSGALLKTDFNQTNKNTCVPFENYKISLPLCTRYNINTVVQLSSVFVLNG